MSVRLEEKPSPCSDVHLRACEPVETAESLIEDCSLRVFVLSFSVSGGGLN